MNPSKDSEKIFPASKRIAIGATSSLGDLKAELLRRKAEAANKVRAVKVSASSGSEKWKKQAEKLESVGKLKEIKPGKKLSQEEEENSKLDEDLKKSREALERKTRIYEQRYNRAIQEVSKNSSESEEDDDSDELVNFKEKVFLDMRTGNLNVIQSSPKRDYDDEEDWVEFTDSLGRTRRCLKHDLNHYKKLDEEVAATAKSRLKSPEDASVKSHETSADYESFLRQGSHGEGNGEGNDGEPKVGPIHYRDVLKDEIRDHGVAYFAFSSDDAERKKQRELLDNLRDQTKKSRVEALKLRKEQKMDRLRKIAEEQGIPFNEDDVTSSDDSDDDKVGSRSESAFDSTSSRDREVEQLKHLMTRDWDVGKKDDSGKTITPDPQLKSEEGKPKPRLKCSQKDYIKSRREERQQEFAPPTFYYNVGIASNNDNNSPGSASKGFNCHPSTKRFKSAPIAESSTQSVTSSSNPSGSSCPNPSGSSSSNPSGSPSSNPSNDFEKIIEEKLKLFKNSSS